MVKYSNWLVTNFGHIDWAEEHLGTMGGSRLMWKLIGLVLIIGSFLVISGLMNNIILSIFTPFGAGK